MLGKYGTPTNAVSVCSQCKFVRHNKESQNITRRFNNKKHNICSQILKRLWDFFFHNNDHTNKKGIKEIVEDIVDKFVHVLVREDNDEGDTKGFF